MSSRKQAVTKRMFIQAYVPAASYGEVAENTGLSESTVRARVTQYRKLGINLEPKPKVTDNSKLTVEEANALIQQLKAGG